MAPYSSLPIYKLGEMLLDSRFDSPILLLQSFQFFVAFLHETQGTGFNSFFLSNSSYLTEPNQGISLGHKYYEKHPEAEFLDKLRRRLVELSEFFTDSSIQVNFIKKEDVVDILGSAVLRYSKHSSVIILDGGTVARGTASS